MQQLLYIENIYHLCFSDLLMLFFIQSRESIYEPPRIQFTLWNLQYLSWTESKINSLPLIDVSKLPWYFDRSDSNSSSITSSASLWDVNGVFLLRECIALSSSKPFEEIKLITIVN